MHRRTHGRYITLRTRSSNQYGAGDPNMAGKVTILSLVLLLIISSVVSAPTETEQIEAQNREDLTTAEKDDLKASASHWGGHYGGWGGHYGGHWGGHYGGYWPYYGSYWGWPSYGYWPYGGHYGHHGYWW